MRITREANAFSYDGCMWWKNTPQRPQWLPEDYEPQDHEDGPETPFMGC